MGISRKHNSLIALGLSGLGLLVFTVGLLVFANGTAQAASKSWFPTELRCQLYLDKDLVVVKMPAISESDFRISRCRTSSSELDYEFSYTGKAHKAEIGNQTYSLKMAKFTFIQHEGLPENGGPSCDDVSLGDLLREEAPAQRRDSLRLWFSSPHFDNHPSVTWAWSVLIRPNDVLVLPYTPGGTSATQPCILSR